MAPRPIRQVGKIRATEAARPVSARTRKEQGEKTQAAGVIIKNRRKAKKSNPASLPLKAKIHKIDFQA